MIAWPRSLGWPGLAACAALAAAVPIAGWLTPHWQQQHQQQRNAARPVSVAAASPGLAKTAVALPPAGDPTLRAADLLALAIRSGVAVERSAQRLDRQPAVQRLQLSLSVHGRYADLRAFVEAALQADPALALDAVQLRRASADAGELDAELQWSLLRADGPARAAAPRSPRDGWHPPLPQAVLAWGAPAAPALAAAKPVQPTLPAFPYRWIGRLDDSGGAQALLSGPLRSFGAHAGDVLDGRWRIDNVASARLQLTWLPTGEAVNVDAR